ncbi:MAG: hypothetical protein FWE13_02255 [Firmicutes bacterium]|nr:hypothetical protein [Bacillota bacterium]
MIIKNAFKILRERFGLSWILALYLALVILVVLAISLSFVLPVLSVFREAGIVEQADALWIAVFETGDVTYFGVQLSELWTAVVDVFTYRDEELTILSLVMFIICVLVFRFLIGFYEIPLLKILEGNLSYNAKLSFSNRFLASSGVSSKFAPSKFAITLLFDAIFFGIMYFMFTLFFLPIWQAIAPTIIILYLVLGLAFRSSLIAFWSPKVVVGKSGVRNGFRYSLRKSAKHFGGVYVTFILIWAVILLTNIFLGVFTFGLALIATIPISMLLLNIVNIVLYYERTGRRYWIDGKIVTPKHPRADAIMAQEDV